MLADARDVLKRLLDAALKAADPYDATVAALPEQPDGRVVVLGIGKASARMACAVEDHFGPVEGKIEGMVTVQSGYTAVGLGLRSLEAPHPVPDERSEVAAREMLSMASGMGEGDLLIALVSGGGSAMLALPCEGITLEDKQDITRSLLASGASVAEFNSIRKHLSAIKGGRLADAAHPAKVLTLIVSDVPGDDPASVASGPTVPDPTTRESAFEVLEKYDIKVPDNVMEALKSVPETPKPGDQAFEGEETTIVCRGREALHAAAKVAEAHGYWVHMLGDMIEGDACEVARVQADLALSLQEKGEVPCVILSGGETSVALEDQGRGAGRGGRNTEFLLELAKALDHAPGIFALAADTDGIDGKGGHAGAVVCPDTLLRAAKLGLDLADAQLIHDSAGFFAALGDLVVTGPTGTNVNDFRAILVT